MTWQMLVMAIIIFLATSVLISALGAKPVLIGLAVLIALVCLGSSDYDDETAAQSAYCDNVGAGIWPDYLGTYSQHCGGKQPPKYRKDLPPLGKKVVA